MRFRVYGILIFIVAAVPVLPTYSRLSQMGIPQGLISDQQADLFFLNPAFGEAFSVSELNIYSITQGATAMQLPCVFSVGVFDPCPRFDSVSSYLNLQYVNPVNTRSGFFTGITPYIGFLQYQAPLHGLLSGNATAGGWIAIDNYVVIGLNVTWRMLHIASFGEFQSATPVFESRFSVQPGIRIRPGKIEIGYSALVSDTLVNHIQANYLIASTNSLSENSDTPSFYIVHHIHLRFSLSETFDFFNSMSIQHNTIDYNAHASSFIGIKKDIINLFLGLEYYAKSGEASQADSLILQYRNNLIDLRASIDLHLLNWLDLRAGMLVYSHNFITFPGAGFADVFTFEFAPSIDGGVRFNFSENSDLEINLQQEGIFLSAANPGVKVSFQYTAKFSGKKSI